MPYTAPDDDAVNFELRSYAPPGNDAVDLAPASVPQVSGLTVTAVTATSIDPSWNAVSEAAEYEVYRAQSPGSDVGDYSQVATVSAPTTSYSDTGLVNGRTYHYRVRALNDAGDTGELSDEVSDTTSLPALDISLTSGSREVDASVTVQDNNPDGEIELYRSTDGSVGSLVSDGLAVADQTVTHTGLRDGEQYYVTARRKTPDAQTDTQDSATTPLPDAVNLQADASVEDELTVQVDDSINYGSYRWEYRVTGSGNPYTSEGTTGEATPQTTITSLLDGEEYDVRVRTETEHVQGAWLSVSPITLLPAPTGETVSSTTGTSVTIGFGDESDNEDEFRLDRETQDASGSWINQQTVATTGAGSTSITDDTPVPETTYRYRVVAATEHVTAASSWVEATTGDLGQPRTSIPTDGWYVEVDHPNAPDPVRPGVLDEQAEILPRLNARPEVRVPVRRDESWLATSFEDVSMRVWKDGRQLPIDELEDVEIDASRVVLVARGGSELDQNVTAQYTSEPAMDAFTDLVTSNTTLPVNADNPDPGDPTSILIVDESTATGLLELFGADAPTAPFIDNGSGGMELAQTCFTQEGENWNTAVGSGMSTGQGNQSGGFAGFIDAAGEVLEYEFTSEYTIPADDFSCFMRIGNYDSSSFISHTISIELESGAEYDMQSLDHTGGDILFGWRDVAQNPTVGSGYTGPDIPPGTHTLRVTGDANNTDAHLIVDVVAPADGRWPYTLDDDNGGDGGYLDGPERYPVVTQTSSPAGAALAVVGGDAATVWSSTAGSQQLELSNDSGQTYPVSASNTSSVSGSFPDAGESLQLRATFSGHGLRSDATPKTGYQTMAVESVQLTIEAKDIPVIARQRYSGSLAETLAEIANTHDLIWAVERQDGDQVIELTRPGLRETDVSLPTSSYSVRKESSRVLKATIEGVGRETETTVTAAHGTAVALGESPVIAGSERVVDQSAGTEYDHGEDYTVDWEKGEMTALSGGAIADGEDVDVRYRYKITGSYEADSYSGDPSTEIRKRVPELTSERACETFAFRLVDELQTALWTASVDVTAQDSQLSLVDALDLDALPSGVPAQEVWSLQNTPSGVSLQLGNRGDIEETFQELRSTVGTLSEQA